MNKSTRRTIKAPTGTTLTAKSWLTEAPLRMLMNNLDPEVAERPDDLVVYGGIGKAARNWECFDAIVAKLKVLETDEAQVAFALLTLLAKPEDRVALRYWLGFGSPSWRAGEYARLRAHCESSGVSQSEALLVLVAGSLSAEPAGEGAAPG